MLVQVDDAYHHRRMKMLDFAASKAAIDNECCPCFAWHLPSTSPARMRDGLLKVRLSETSAVAKRRASLCRPSCSKLASKQTRQAGKDAYVGLVDNESA